MIVSLLVALSVVLALLSLYPFAGYPLLLRLLPSRPLNLSEDVATTGAEFALFFAFFNEADSLPAKVENLRAIRSRYPGIEIWAYDDCSDDGSVKILEGANLGIRIVRGEVRAGKASGMKKMVDRSARDFLVFTDANVIVDIDAISTLAKYYSDDRVGGVCGTLKYTAQAGTSTESVGGLYWRLEEFIKGEESRSGNVMGADGSIFSVRRELYPDFADSVQDDFTVSMAVVFAGRRLVHAEDVIAFEELVSRRGIELQRKIRIATRAFHTHQQFRDRLRGLSARDGWCYFSHKWLRWHSGFFLVLAAMSGLAAIMIVSPWLGVAAALVVAGAAGWARTRTGGAVASVVDIVASLAAASLGTLSARAGRTMSTWQPPRVS